MIAEWILAQRAYKETDTSFGLLVGKTSEELTVITICLVTLVGRPDLPSDRSPATRGSPNQKAPGGAFFYT